MKGLTAYICLIFSLLASLPLSGQNEIKPWDWSRAYSRIGFEGQRVDLVDGEIFRWAFNGSFAFGQEKHQVGLEVPFLRADFFSDIERRTGIGDIQLGYLYAFGGEFGVVNLNNFSAGLDLTIPTGNEDLGRGFGALALSPIVNHRIRFSELASLVSSVRYVHSLKESYGDWGGDGPIVGDPNDPLRKLRDMKLSVTPVLEFGEGAWFSTGLYYTQYFQESDYTMDLKPEIGKIWDNKWSLILNSTLWLAGQRRVDSQIEFKLGYFFFGG